MSTTTTTGRQLLRASGVRSPRQRQRQQKQQKQKQQHPQQCLSSWWFREALPSLRPVQPTRVYQSGIVLCNSPAKTTTTTMMRFESRMMVMTMSSSAQQLQQQQQPLSHNDDEGQIPRAVTASAAINGDQGEAASAQQSHRDRTRSRNHQQQQQQLDFFGEPVTFSFVRQAQQQQQQQQESPPAVDTSRAMAAMDAMILAVVSRGQSCWGGGDEAGLLMQPIHAAAMTWSQALYHAAAWNGVVSTLDDDEHAPPFPLRRSAPMLAVAAVAPVLAQAGCAYVRHLDTLLKQTRPVAPGLPVVQMIDIAKVAIQQRSSRHLDARERAHLQALYYLLQDDHPAALLSYTRLLRASPGDVLAMSIAMDLCHTLGDAHQAAQIASSVAAYWHERRGGWIRPALPGHAMMTAYIALGMAVGGRTAEAEFLSIQSMHAARKRAGAVATWAAAHIYDASGRVAEGISALANMDGRVNYEGSGWLFHEARLASYGARFSLDREERGRGKSAALRLYDECMDPVLQYSGFATGQAWNKPQQPAPLGWTFDSSNNSKVLFYPTTIETDMMLESGEERDQQQMKGRDKESSFFSRLFGTSNNNSGRSNDGSTNHAMLRRDGQSTLSTKIDGWEPACEDVLTWLPPTPQILTDSTLLLLRFTLNGTISHTNDRWDHMRQAWSTLLALYQLYDQNIDNDDESSVNRRLSYCPMASIAASLLVSPSETGGNNIGNGRLARGLHQMGNMLKLGKKQRQQQQEQMRSDLDTAALASTDEEESITLKLSPTSSITYAMREVVAEREPDFWLPVKDDDMQSKNQWRHVVQDLSSAIDGYTIVASETDPGSGIDDENDEDSLLVDSSLRFAFSAWPFDARPILEHAVVYAACKAGDANSLILARSICSAGVTLRPNSPEEWWRYSIVLGLLGDEVGSEDALQTSINVGAGQGARGT